MNAKRAAASAGERSTDSFEHAVVVVGGENPLLCAYLL